MMLRSNLTSATSIATNNHATEIKSTSSCKNSENIANLTTVKNSHVFIPSSRRIHKSFPPGLKTCPSIIEEPNNAELDIVPNDEDIEQILSNLRNTAQYMDSNIESKKNRTQRYR